MAELRLILIVALMACRSSEAGPGSGLTPPAGWQPLPPLAAAATEAAKAGKLTVDGAEAWGEPARGCYAAWFALRTAGGAPDVIADQLVNSLRVDPALFGVLIKDVVTPRAGDARGVLSLAFERAQYRGKLAAVIAKEGKLTALACFWNPREPRACEQACNGLLGGLK
jgi:hypothetical protein